MEGARAMLKDGLFTRFPKPDVALAHLACACLWQRFHAGSRQYSIGGATHADSPC